MLSIYLPYSFYNCQSDSLSVFWKNIIYNFFMAVSLFSIFITLKLSDFMFHNFIFLAFFYDARKMLHFFFSFEFQLSVHQSHLLYLFCLHLLCTLSKMSVLSFIWTTSSGFLFSSLHWLVQVLFCAFFVQWSIFPLT